MTTLLSDLRVMPDMPAEEYFAHPALSASGAKILAQPGGPAKYHYQLTHPQPPKREFDLGHAVHAELLGTGPELVAIPDDLLAANGAVSTSAAKAFVAEARKAGAVPLKSGTIAEIRTMVNAVLTHSRAKALLEQATLREVSLFRSDEHTGADLRARLDAVGPRAVVDIKTAVSADPAEWKSHARKLGYHIQAQWYHDMAIAHGLTDPRQPVRFVNVEKTPPYLVSVCVIDPIDLVIAEQQIRHAITAWLHGQATGQWPGYPTQDTQVSFPGWWRDQFEERLADDIADELEALAQRLANERTPS